MREPGGDGQSSGRAPWPWVATELTRPCAADRWTPGRPPGRRGEGKNGRAGREQGMRINRNLNADDIPADRWRSVLQTSRGARIQGLGEQIRRAAGERHGRVQNPCVATSQRCGTGERTTWLREKDPATRWGLEMRFGDGVWIKRTECTFP